MPRSRCTDFLGCDPTRSIEEGPGSQTSLVVAIAQELMRIDGGKLTEHLRDARRLLSQAFREMEQPRRTCGTGEFEMIRDEGWPGGGGLCGHRRAKLERM